MSHNYKIKYKFEPQTGNFSKEEIKSSKLGGCDAFVFISLIYSENGSFSMQTHDLDGRSGKELHVEELFKVWMLLGNALSDDDNLGGGRKEFCQTVSEHLRFCMHQIKSIEEGEFH